MPFWKRWRGTTIFLKTSPALGENNRILDEVIATFSPQWKTDLDHFELLCSYIISLAAQGNVIIVELGGAIITRHIEQSCHFRLYVSDSFKTATLTRRLNLSVDDAEKFMHRQQKKARPLHPGFPGREWP